MKGLYGRLVWRPLRLEAGRAVLAILAVALGVSVFLAIRLANRAAVASFDGFARGVGTGAEYTVRACLGALDEAGLARLEPLRRDFWIRPVLEGGFSRLTSGAPETFQILATDLVGLEEGGDSGLGQGLLEPRAVLVSRADAREKDERLQSLRAFQERHREAAGPALERLREQVRRGGNLFDVLMDTVQVASLGQITSVLYEMGGKYRRSM